jgi:hypothetical protein
MGLCHQASDIANRLVDIMSSYSLELEFGFLSVHKIINTLSNIALNKEVHNIMLDLIDPWPTLYLHNCNITILQLNIAIYTS